MRTNLRFALVLDNLNPAHGSLHQYQGQVQISSLLVILQDFDFDYIFINSFIKFKRRGIGNI